MEELHCTQRRGEKEEMEIRQIQGVGRRRKGQRSTERER